MPQPDKFVSSQNIVELFDIYQKVCCHSVLAVKIMEVLVCSVSDH